MEPVHWDFLELEPYRPTHKKRKLRLGRFTALIEWELGRLSTDVTKKG